MSIGGIVFYVNRATHFACYVSLVWVAVRTVILIHRGEKPNWRWEAGALAFAFYLAALTEIIAIRGGPGSARSAQLIPMKTILASAKDGLWPFLYHTLGNCAWFAPLGIFLYKKGAARTLLWGVALSATLEIGQWLLKTGITDIDDVILNALGALIGQSIVKRFKNR